MDEQRPNFFELLDTTPAELGDNEAEIKKFIQVKRINKWQRNKNAKNKKRLEYKDAILQVMLDPTQRQQEARDFERRRREAQRRLEDEVRRLINHAIKDDLAGRRYLLIESINQIVADEQLNKQFSADDVRSFVPDGVDILADSPVESVDEPGNFDLIKNYIPQIEEYLEIIKTDNLYKFLGQPASASAGALQQAANKKYKEANDNPNKTQQVEATSKLAGICQTIFKDTDRRVAYNHYEEQRKYKPFREEIDRLAKLGGKTLTEHAVGDLHKKAGEVGLTQAEAEQELKRYARIQGYSIHIETTTVAPFKMKKGQARNPKELAALIDQNWEESKDYLSRDTFERWLSQAGEAPLSSAISKIRKTHSDSNVALELCVQALDPALPKPAVKVLPAVLDFGGLEEMQGKQQHLTVEHASGRGWVSGSVTASTNSWLEFSPDSFNFGPGGIQKITVTVKSAGLGAGVKKQGELLFEPEPVLGAASLKVPVQMEVIFPWRQLAWQLSIGAGVGLGISTILAYLLDMIFGSETVGDVIVPILGLIFVVSGLILGGKKEHPLFGGVIGGILAALLYQPITTFGHFLSSIQITTPILYYSLAGFIGAGLGAAVGNYKAFKQMNRAPMGVLFSAMAVITVFGLFGGGFALGDVFSIKSSVKQIETITEHNQQNNVTSSRPLLLDQVAYNVDQSTVYNDDFKLTLNVIEAEDYSLKFEFTVENISNRSQNWQANEDNRAVFLLVDSSERKKLYPTNIDGIFTLNLYEFKPGRKLKGWFVFPQPNSEVFEFHYLQAESLSIDLSNLNRSVTPQPTSSTSQATSDSSSSDSLAIATSTRAPTRPPAPRNSAEVQALCTEIYVVQKGDWASRIAEDYLGDFLAFDQIIEATNQARQYDSSFVNLRDPDKLEVGDKLCIPASKRVEVLSSDNDPPQLFIKINGSEICGCSPQSGMIVYDLGSKAQFCFWSNTVTTTEASISFPNNSQPTYTFPVLENLDGEQQCHDGPMPNHPAGVYTLKMVSLTTPSLEQTLRFKLDECQACK